MMHGFDNVEALIMTNFNFYRILIGLTSLLYIPYNSATHWNILIDMKLGLSFFVCISEIPVCKLIQLPRFLPTFSLEFLGWHKHSCSCSEKMPITIWTYNRNRRYLYYIPVFRHVDQIDTHLIIDATCPLYFLCDLIWFLVFNSTFSSISAISWRPVLVVEEAGVPGENHRPWASNWSTLSLAAFLYM